MVIVVVIIKAQLFSRFLSVVINLWLVMWLSLKREEVKIMSLPTGRYHGTTTSRLLLSCSTSGKRFASVQMTSEYEACSMY